MKEGIVRIDEVGRLVIPKEARKVLKINESKLVHMYVERDKIIIKKYQPILNELSLASKICLSIASVTNSICLVCDMQKVICVSHNILSDLKGKKLSNDFVNAMQNGMPLLLNASEGSELFPLFNNCSYDYYSVCAVLLESEQAVGYLMLINPDKTQKFQTQTLDILTVAKGLIEGVL